MTKREGALRWLPGLHTLRKYEPAWLPHDLVAGLVLAAMLVPVGVAYAIASGVPGIHGLYATIIPLLAYAMFGPAAYLSWDPTRHWPPSSSVSSFRCPVETRNAPSCWPA